jgi:hypothetical protein
MVQTDVYSANKNLKTASHLFVSCPFIGQVSMALKKKIKAGADWINPSFEECYKFWIHDISLNLYAGLPCILVENLWRAHIAAVFKDKWMSPEVIKTLILA